MNFLQRFQMFCNRFMAGRYGTDTLNRHLLILWVVLAVLNIFVTSVVVSFAELILCILCFYRMLSRNHAKRMRENAVYYQFSQKMTRTFRHFAIRIRDRKVARFFKCPKCSAPIRMPRKVGKFNIRCQKCNHTFQKEFKR